MAQLENPQPRPCRVQLKPELLLGAESLRSLFSDTQVMGRPTTAKIILLQRQKIPVRMSRSEVLSLLKQKQCKADIFLKRGVTLAVLFLEVSLPLGMWLFQISTASPRREGILFAWGFFYIEEWARPLCTGTRGEITKTYPEQKELCADLSTMQRFTVMPFL